MILELSFQDIGHFITIKENNNGIMSIGKNDHGALRLGTIGVNREKRRFVDLVVGSFADGELFHGGDKVTDSPPTYNNFLLFFLKKILRIYCFLLTTSI